MDEERDSCMGPTRVRAQLQRLNQAVHQIEHGKDVSDQLAGQALQATLLTWFHDQGLALERACPDQKNTYYELIIPYRASEHLMGIAFDLRCLFTQCGLLYVVTYPLPPQLPADTVIETFLSNRLDEVWLAFKKHGYPATRMPNHVVIKRSEIE